MTSNQIQLIGALPIGYYLYRQYQSISGKGKPINAIDNGVAFVGVAIIIYSMMK